MTATRKQPTSTLPGPLAPETGETLSQAGAYAARIVAQAREMRIGEDDSDREFADARRMSGREIAEEIGISPSTVLSQAKRLELKPQNGHFGLDDMVRLRAAVGKTRKRTGLEPCIKIAVVNFKGGVGKSSTCATLGYHLALKGYRTLLVDIDPQATLSTLMSVQPDFSLTGDETLLPYLVRNADEDIEGEAPRFRPQTLDYAIRSTELSTLKVIPASLPLDMASMMLISQQHALGKDGGWFYTEALAEGLATIEDQFDVILIDCAPSLGPLTTVAATAADALLIPMRPSLPDFASSAQFLTMCGQSTMDNDEVRSLIYRREGLEKKYLWARVLLTQSLGRTADKEISEYVRAAYRARVLGPDFPHLTAVAAATNRMRTIYDVARADVGREALRRARTAVDALGADIESLILMSRQQLMREAA